MKLHPRSEIVGKAEREFTEFMIEFRTKHDLTRIEWMQMLNSHLASCLKYELRWERNRDEDFPAEMEK